MLTIQQLYRSWFGRLRRQILHYLRKESPHGSHISTSRRRRARVRRVLGGVASLGIYTGRIKETFNSHPLRIDRRSLLRPPFGYRVQILELCHRIQAPRCPPSRRHLARVSDC